jgi:hypothetical protein
MHTHTESGVFRGPKTGGVQRQSSLVIPENSRTVATARISSACWHASSPVSCDTNWIGSFLVNPPILNIIISKILKIKL